MGERDRDELVLIQRSQDGDTAAFGELYQRYKQAVYSLAYRVVRNQADADELMQESFIRAYRYLARYDKQYSFYTWLRTIVINLGRDWLRKRKSQQVKFESYASEPARSSPPGARLDRIADRQLLNQAINELSNQQRLCFILFEVEGLTLEEISVQLRCSVGTVKTHLHRARNQLRNKLKNDYSDFK
ncbi:MAG: sigma-70 family RNA polymerase sigma factor [bacterium]|nr:sigma-70 family RNA polymerase sigma factor [bacterium]